MDSEYSINETLRTMWKAKEGYANNCCGESIEARRVAEEWARLDNEINGYPMEAKDEEVLWEALVNSTDSTSSSSPL
ncbi:MAG: hypothetical protein HOG49_31945 [Candidatus Scalindua sp.]|jgi:hypothetical protein|nr:hypothetical protein [Candidatus Scalindua sp.]